jgi:parvulin-like peptidyl-prolyl isomerase
MRNFRSLMLALPPQQQQQAMNNRKGWIEWYAAIRKLANMAEKEKLHEASPTRELIEFNRLFYLSQAELNARMNSSVVDGAEIVKEYEANKERYQKVKVRVIYISFVPAAAAAAAANKGVTEDQARAKAEKLVAQLRQGADFVKLVKEHSEDQTSAAKEGDFGTLRRSDNIPDAIRSAVFALKEGEVSEPVRQANGFYIFRADKVSLLQLSEVRDEIYNELKDRLYKDWLNRFHAETKVTLVNDEFFSSAPNATAPAPKPPTQK